MMISHLKLRLAASALTLAVVLQPHVCHAQAAAPAPLVQMDHISVEIVGTGPAVILIPGLASPRAVWDGVTPALAASHTVYRVQVNGFGGSAPGGNLSPGVLAGIVADLHTLITTHRLGGTAVIGHSLGGLVGMMLARSHPADVSRLMIVDSLPDFAVLMMPPGIEPTPATVEPLAKAMRDRVAATYGAPLSDAAAAAQTRGLALKPDSIATIGRWARTADARVSAQAMYEDLTTDLRPDMAALTLPITLVYPWSDAAFGKERTDAFYHAQYAAAPHVTYVPVGDSAHFVMLDQPAAFATAVAGFLK